MNQELDYMFIQVSSSSHFGFVSLLLRTPHVRLMLKFLYREWNLNLMQ